MRRLLLSFFLFIFYFVSNAQPFGNEWINYSQKYYYVKVVQNGIYRIDYNALLNAGIPITSINPKNFQVFGREQELFIHVEGEQDDSFDPGDYIEFYAEKNDGRFDTILYSGENNMPDTYFSNYNDTLRYYFTWNNSTSNRRMKIETDTDFTSYSPISFVWKSNYLKNPYQYLTGEYNTGSSSSLLTRGEGWFYQASNGVSGGYVPEIYNVPTPNAFSGIGAPDANVKMSLASNSDADHFSSAGNHHSRFAYGPSYSNIALDTVYSGYQLIKKQFSILASDVGSPNTSFQFSIINDLTAVTDFQSFGSVTVKYPHTLNFGYGNSTEFTLPNNSSEVKSRLDFTGFSYSNARMYIISDSVKRVPVSGVANNHQTLIPNHFANQDQRIFLTDNSLIQTFSNLIPVNGNGDFTDFGNNIADSAYIILTHSSLLTEAGQYAIYRSSPAGGGYNTMVVDVEQLYDQYGSGIQKHSLALKRFCADMIASSSIPPSNLFLLGKGIREANESSGFMPGTRASAASFQANLVPSFGYPSSDVLITAGITVGTYTPAIPTGRLAATNGTEVLEYLDKVIEYEAMQQSPVYTFEDKAWMKHILHFAGGANLNEQVAFSGYLNDFAQISEDTLFGAYTTAYAKQTSSPINPVDFSEIAGFLEEGVSLMTFFGHASSSGFDQNIDDPVNWNNQGKYPFLLGNGCYAGDIYQPSSVSNSEEFVLYPQRGTIGFLSTSKVGFAGPLYWFSREFYQQFSYKNYGNTIGKQTQETVEFMENLSFTSFIDDNVAMQMALHGDPAIKLNYHKAPEFVVRNQDIFFDPPVVSLGTDSVNVNVVVYNLGSTTSDSVQVELIRHFPNNNGDSIYTKSISGRKFVDTVVFRLAVLHNLATGINIFDAAVDIPSSLDEAYDEISNNQATSTLFINSNGIATIYPYEYAIVPDSVLTFKASTLNPLAPSRNYRFEIDTTDLFNSPFKKISVVNSPGGVVDFECADLLNATSGLSDPLIFTDSTVYFWRVSPDSTVFVWDESSFQYIPGQTGWGQAHFFQFKNNVHQSVNYDRPSRSWIWDETFRIFTASLHVFGTTNPQWIATEWTLDGAMQDYTGCGNPVFNPSIHVAVVDPITLEPWGTYNCVPSSGPCASCTLTNFDHQFGNANNGCGSCRGRVEKYFIFRQNDPASMDSMISMYNNKIPAGHYVLFYTFTRAEYSLWQPHYYTFFNSIGATNILPGNPNEGWIYYTQKGNETNFSGYNSSDSSELITVRDTLRSLEYQGKMSSEIAGPASEWYALYWQQEAKESPTYDSTQLILIGIKNNGGEDTLLNIPFTELDSIINLGSIVDATIYPRVRLGASFFDDQLFTPAQINRWQLLYQPLPEAAVNPQLGFYFNTLNDSIFEGEDFEIAVAIENISPYHMDSLLVHYWVEDENRILNYISYPRQDSLRAGEILYDTVRISSAGFPGLNSIWMEVNPIPLTSNIPVYDQLEQFHFNNYLQIPFFVIADEMNPILDVTFDGLHILNGDIVSGKPNIHITLKDENPYLIMNETRDTAHFAVYLTDPLGNQKRIWFNQGVNSIMSFIPSTGPNDKFKIDYNPTLYTDGKYRLLIQASDKSGNASGDFDYEIDFEVINQSSITEVMNYPNPFSTKTHFVFTLTGSVIPDYMKIQIMTISGKIVREIMVDELGPIRIGRNITEYAWDGRDEFGDQLANGIYLYRVITKINGEAVEKRESGADTYFTKGFGKMQLMR